MINQIRADFYRQWHSIGLGLTALATIALSFVITWQQAPGGIVVNAPEKLMARLAAKDWTVADGLHGATISSSVLLYLFIAIFVIVIGYEFSQKTYKNSLITGVTRLGFILGKYFTLLIDLMAAMLLYYGTSWLTGVLLGRPFGGSFNKLLTFGATTWATSTFFISVIFSLAILCLILTRSSVISVVFIVVWPLVVATITSLTKWHWLRYLDFFGSASNITFGIVPLSEMWQYLLVSGLILIGSIIAAAFLIRHQEL